MFGIFYLCLHFNSNIINSNINQINKIMKNNINNDIIDTLAEKLYQWLGEENVRYFRHLKGLKKTLIPILNLNKSKKGIPFHNVHLREGMQVRNFLRKQKECVEWDSTFMDDNYIKIIERCIEKNENNKTKEELEMILESKQKEINKGVEIIKSFMSLKTGEMIGMSAPEESINKLLNESRFWLKNNI